MQLLTVRAHKSCNGIWSDDEVHFRNVLLLAGEASATVNEVWSDETLPSFREADGRRRIRDLVQGMEPVEVGGEERHVIYPARDPAVLRVLRKIVRGLCYEHFDLTPVADEQIWVDVLKFQVPDSLRAEATYSHRDPSVVHYLRYAFPESHLHSGWLITFYERCEFIAIVGDDPMELNASAA